MSLTNDEQDALAVIERGLRRDDPLLAEHFAGAPTVDQRQRRVVWAHRMIVVGAVVTLLGLITADGLMSLGTILCGYGLVIVLIAICVAVHNRTLGRARHGRFWWT